MRHILKKLIDDNVLDFKGLVLKYYHKFDLNEREAIALIKLHTLLEEKQQIIKPKKFAQWLATSPAETEKILNNLITKGYLNIHLYEDDDGKERESFNVDYFLIKVVEHLKHDYETQQKNDTSIVIDFLEDMFKQPLSQLDYETVKQWIFEEEFDIDMIKDATYQAFENKQPSLRQIDHILVNQLKDAEKKPASNKDALKDFHRIWEE